MLIELRARDGGEFEKSLALTSVLPLVGGIGDEGCWHKVPDLPRLRECRARLRDAGRAFRLVTPKVPELHAENALATIAELVRDDPAFELTANDLGLLHALGREGLLPERVALGRTLSRSAQDCPWIRNIVRDTTAFGSRALLQNSLLDQDELRFLRRFRVDSVETNTLAYDASSLSALRALGLRVRLHCGPVAVSFSRACATARFFRRAVPGCKELCAQPLSIAMGRIWERGSFAPAPEALQPHRRFLLLGNVLYQAARPALAPAVDEVIVSLWWNECDVQRLIRDIEETYGHGNSSGEGAGCLG